MRLEHRNEKVATLPRFFIRILKYFFFSTLLIAISLGIGTAGYMYLGKLSFLDSFHMSAMILTGMGPVVEMKSDVAKIFSSFYALYSGIAFLTITAVFFSPIVHRLLHILQMDSDKP